MRKFLSILSAFPLFIIGLTALILGLILVVVNKLMQLFYKAMTYITDGLLAISILSFLTPYFIWGKSNDEIQELNDVLFSMKDEVSHK